MPGGIHRQRYVADRVIPEDIAQSVVSGTGRVDRRVLGADLEMKRSAIKDALTEEVHDHELAAPVEPGAALLAFGVVAV